MLNGPQSRIMATFANRTRSCSTTALMKCVVPIVTLATSFGSVLDFSNMAVMALLIPSLGFPVVETLCQAMIPRPGSEERVGSRITPSVFVLVKLSATRSFLVFVGEITHPPTSTPIRRFPGISLREIVDASIFDLR